MGTTILSFQHRVVIETLHNEGRSDTLLTT